MAQPSLFFTSMEMFLPGPLIKYLAGSEYLEASRDTNYQMLHRNVVAFYGELLTFKDGNKGVYDIWR